MIENRLVELRTTFPSESLAMDVANELVGQKLAACIQVLGPMKSVFCWQGKIESASEWRLCAKTLESKRETCLERIRKLHPYDVPELVVFCIEDASSDYRRWIESELQ